MANFSINLTGVQLPTRDGEVIEYTHPEAAVAKNFFQATRRVIFVNGMKNSPADHAESALALSLVQMCPVLGIYNRTAGAIVDLAQCLGDKWQFNSPLSPSAATRTAVGSLINPQRPREQILIDALSRNPAALALFQMLRQPQHRHRDIFAHSQGNLILSNALQALEALEGPGTMSGFTVHSYGSPAAKWPKSVRRREHGFTWDPVTWLAGFDTSLSIAKVGMPRDSLQPVTHSFLEYFKLDPEFVVNRFRIGALRLTFRMDEAGLANCLLAMGSNIPRVRRVFEHLKLRHGSDVDDVAEAYVQGIDSAPERQAILQSLRADPGLVQLLIQVMVEGWKGGGERAAIDRLRRL